MVPLHICSAWCNIESVMCFMLPASWQHLCSVLPFHRWAPLQQRLCLFYTNSPLTPMTTYHVQREVRKLNKPRARQRKVPFKIRQSLFLIGVIHLGLTKCHIPASIICITSKVSRRVCSALIYPLAWEMLPLLTQSSKRVRLWHFLIY